MAGLTLQNQISIQVPPLSVDSWRYNEIGDIMIDEQRKLYN